MCCKFNSNPLPTCSTWDHLTPSCTWKTHGCFCLWKTSVVLPRWIWRIRPHPHDLALETRLNQIPKLLSGWFNFGTRWHVDLYVWAFPKIGVLKKTLNHPFVHRVFHLINHPYWGKTMENPLFLETPVLSLIFRTLPFTSLEPLRPCMRYGAPSEKFRH